MKEVVHGKNEMRFVLAASSPSMVAAMRNATSLPWLIPMLPLEVKRLQVLAQQSPSCRVVADSSKEMCCAWT